MNHLGDELDPDGDRCCHDLSDRASRSSWVGSEFVTEQSMPSCLCNGAGVIVSFEIVSREAERTLVTPVLYRHQTPHRPPPRVTKGWPNVWTCRDR